MRARVGAAVVLLTAGAVLLSAELLGRAARFLDDALDIDIGAPDGPGYQAVTLRCNTTTT